MWVTGEGVSTEKIWEPFANMRLMRLSHYTSQEILYRLSPLCEEFYDLYGELSLEDMSSFAPTLELSTSLHERGKGRLFMN